MAKLINGNGNPAIYAGEDADLIASLAGNVTCIANVGNKCAATEEDATTIRLDDGVIVTKEGRRIQLEAGESDTFYIPTGTSGVTNYYIIGYKLVQNADSTQVAEQFVQKMNSSSETITEDTFRSGATEVYVSLYRVTQVDFTITSITGLLPELLDSNSAKDDIAQINNDMKNKASGLALTQDLNTVTETGVYYCLGACSNQPIAGKYGTLMVADGKTASTYICQTFIIGDSTDMYTRYSTNDGLTWTTWKAQNKTLFNSLVGNGESVQIPIRDNVNYLVVGVTQGSSDDKGTINIFSNVYGAKMVNLGSSGGSIYINWNYLNNVLTLVNMDALVVNLSVTEL